ncbi:hypothetical protein RKE30_21765 [Streptomyces sp. Li-HN-5-11]|uniref:hypothetical protein n=1 Tax=Streptomyces sp. Li-HN-5-11 TaxID=3075432 RepID=UPI0028A8621A|nr:hypothetical protein [Streptomyces sp. Li-HN-5-11]WNM32829.1 hypothetical protein RKE30_21765 [Streptomyces sp. Li-HN-5-11]
MAERRQHRVGDQAVRVRGEDDGIGGAEAMIAAQVGERLAIDLASEADLMPLAGHPHLASLAVGSETPIDLAPLRSLPALRSLDLSRCTAPDLALPADLPGLRCLALSATQWTALIAAGRLPAHLAAARLAGAPPLTAALELLAALGVDTSMAYRLSGTVDGHGRGGRPPGPVTP